MSLTAEQIAKLAARHTQANDRTFCTSGEFAEMLESKAWREYTSWIDAKLRMEQDIMTLAESAEASNAARVKAKLLIEMQELPSIIMDDFAAAAHNKQIDEEFENAGTDAAERSI